MAGGVESRELLLAEGGMVRRRDMSLRGGPLDGAPTLRARAEARWVG